MGAHNTPETRPCPHDTSGKSLSHFVPLCPTLSEFLGGAVQAGEAAAHRAAAARAAEAAPPPDLQRLRAALAEAEGRAAKAEAAALAQDRLKLDTAQAELAANQQATAAARQLAEQTQENLPNVCLPCWQPRGIPPCRKRRILRTGRVFRLPFASVSLFRPLAALTEAWVRATGVVLGLVGLAASGAVAGQSGAGAGQSGGDTGRPADGGAAGAGGAAGGGTAAPAGGGAAVQGGGPRLPPPARPVPSARSPLHALLCMLRVRPLMNRNQICMRFAFCAYVKARRHPPWTASPASSASS
eukprot:632731-Prorocentrum_minimum.AAC.3